MRAEGLSTKTVDRETFREHLLDEGVLDPEGIHHEFVRGMHGRKLHFDRVRPGTSLYDEWVVVGAQTLRELHPDLSGLILVSVAEGTNDVTVDIAEELGEGVIGLQTEKVGSRQVRLNKIARQVIRAVRPKRVCIFEDASTEGTIVLTAAEDLRSMDIEDPEVLTTWQRRHRLELLENAGIYYNAIIDEPVPTYTPEDCRRMGHCAAMWELIRHG